MNERETAGKGIRSEIRKMSKSNLKLLVTVNGELIEKWGCDSHPTHSRIYHLINELKRYEDLEILYVSFSQRARGNWINCIYNNIIKTWVAIKYLFLIMRHAPVVYFEYPYYMTVLQNRIIFKVCVLLGVKTVLDVHDTRGQSEAISNSASALSWETERYCLRNATLISFSLNASMWSQLAETYGIPVEKKVVFIPNAFEEAFINEFEARSIEDQESRDRISSGRFNICYIGGISKNRGVDILVTACSRLHDRYPYLRLYLFGEYSEGFSRDIIDLIETSDFIRRMVVIRRDLPSMIKDMDLFVMPYNPHVEYTNACSPTKYFEYMATGRPVLSTRCKSILDAARGGVMYADYNVSDFEAKIEELMADSELRERLSAEQAEQRWQHTWRERAKRLHDAIMEI